MTICDNCPCRYVDFDYNRGLMGDAKCGLGGGEDRCLGFGTRRTSINTRSYYVEDTNCPLDHIVLKDGTIFRPEVT